MKLTPLQRISVELSESGIDGFVCHVLGQFGITTKWTPTGERLCLFVLPPFEPLVSSLEAMGIGVLVRTGNVLILNAGPEQYDAVYKIADEHANESNKVKSGQ